MDGVCSGRVRADAEVCPPTCGPAASARLAHTAAMRSGLVASTCARSPAGIERPLTSSRSVSLPAETHDHESRSAKNCGVIVSANSHA
eukprot:scaffold117281_cov15-Phaeocystis_antarctica.AAC.1